MKRLLCLAALSVLALLILAPTALAQGDNLDPQETQPCPIDLVQFPAGTVCGEGGAYIDPETQEAAEPLPPTTGTDTTGGGDTTAPTTSGSATLSFELTVEGDPPAGITFLGDLPQSYPPVTLTDPDGDGVFTGSIDVPTQVNSPYRPSYPTEFPVVIAQENGGNRTVIEDFGVVTIDGDRTFSAEVDFEQNGGGGTTTPEGTTTGEQTAGETTADETTGADGEVTGPGGEVTTIGADGEVTTIGADGEVTVGAGGDGSANKGDGGPQGGLALAVNDGLGNVARGRLPETGGGWAVLLVAAAVLIGGGWFLVRRFSSSA